MEVARRMREEGVRTMIVASAGSDLIAGSISELDLLRAVAEGRTEGMASDVMSLEAVPTVHAGMDLNATVKRMREEEIGLLVVVGGQPERPMGVLSLADVASFLARR